MSQTAAHLVDHVIPHMPVLAVKSAYTRDDGFDGALAVLDSLDLPNGDSGAAPTLVELRRWHARSTAASASAAAA